MACYIYIYNCVQPSTVLFFLHAFFAPQASSIRTQTSPITQIVFWMSRRINEWIDKWSVVGYLESKSRNLLASHFTGHGTNIFVFIPFLSWSCSSGPSPFKSWIQLEWVFPHTSLVSLTSCHWVSSTCTAGLWPCIAARCKAVFPSCNRDTMQVESPVPRNTPLQQSGLQGCSGTSRSTLLG